MALIASANSDIQVEIASSLHLVDPVVVAHSLDRPNLFFSAGEIKSVSVSIHLYSSRDARLLQFCGYNNIIEGFGWFNYSVV